MKYIKLFENYKWNSITKKSDTIYFHIYDLAKEMESQATDKESLVKLEKEFIKLSKEMLIGKVITFSCGDCGFPNSPNHTGICESVEFHSGFATADSQSFQTEFIQIKLEDLKEHHSIDIDEILIHLDIDPQFFRDTNKYNL